MADIDTSPEAVERKIEEWRGENGYWEMAEAIPLIRQLAKERDEARARVRELEEALRPFATIEAERANDSNRDNFLAWEDVDCPITYGHLRAAARALGTEALREDERG